MNKKCCPYKQVSNSEVDFVISKILDGSFLFAPPVYTDVKGKHCTQPAVLINATTHKLLSYRTHSQSEAGLLVPCQRCVGECNGRFNVYFNKVYQRMVQKGYIEAYPEVVHFNRKIGFGYCVLNTNTLNRK